MNRESKIKLIKDLIAGGDIKEAIGSLVGKVVLVSTRTGCWTYQKTGDPIHLKYNPVLQSNKVYIFTIEKDYYFLEAEEFKKISTGNKDAFLVLPHNGRDDLPGHKLRRFMGWESIIQ